MKVFEVKIKKNRGERETSFEWPSWWGEIYEQVDIVALEDHPKALGKRSEGAICVCDDKTWLAIESKSDPLIVELDESKANEKGRAWRPQVDKPDGSKSRKFDVHAIAQGRGDVLRGKGR